MVQGFHFFTQIIVDNILALLAHQNKNYVPKTQPTFTCSKTTIETFEEGVKYVQR